MLQQTVLNTQRQFNLFPPGSTIVLAVSGGADSLALLHVMAQLHERLHIHLHVATLNHGLRVDAAADVAYVQDIAQQWQLPVSAETINVNELAVLQRIGIEAAGRSARYDFFARVAQQVGASIIATAHHADDQTETILMHMLRGSGVQGLVGMQPKTSLPNHPALTLVRPLLAVRRSDIEAYCAEQQLEPRHDTTNTDTAFLRNALRHTILPRLREINPQIDKALAQLAAIVASEQDFMHTYYQLHIVPQIATDTGRTRFHVHRAHFATWHRAMQHRFIIDTSSQLGAEAHYTHITTAVQTGLHGTVGAIADLTKGVRLRVGYSAIYIEHETTPFPEHDYWLIAAHYPVTLPGQTLCGTWLLEAALEEQPDTLARLHIPADSQVILRTRQVGDRFQPLGMRGHSKTLKNWMIDSKVPQQLRDKIPLLVVDNRIAAIILPQQWVIAEPYTIVTASQHNFYFSIRQR
jgi:tRNA(Ile)-lysidine synthase